MIPALAAAFIFLSVAMAAAWAVRWINGNSGWIDTIWTFSVGAAAAIALTLLPADGARRVLLAGLVGIWSMRLGFHMLARTRRTSDDPRYAGLIEQWGRSAPFRLFLFLQIQALAGFVLVAAVALAADSTAPATSWGTMAFAALAIASVVGEGIADAQLEACKREKSPGGICESGLWAYSRHPNYFFEWLHWLAIALIAICPATSALSWAALAAPAMMYLLLRYGSGVPHIELHMQRTRPAAFADYAKRVPVFFPRLWKARE